MSQTHLFLPVPFLGERLGEELFNGIPQQPGVYRFYDVQGELLYVGKAKNLRRRLFSYKRARAGQVSGKVSRMIGRIASVEVELTGSEEEALLLENRLIREERPPFNHANKQTEAYYFIYLNQKEDGLEFRLAMQIHEETNPEHWYGCFKGHGPVRRSSGSLLQLLWMAENETVSPLHLPVQLTRHLTPMRYHLPIRPGSPLLRWDAPSMLRHWMLGHSCDLLEWLVVRIEAGRRLTPFQSRFLEDRLHHLKTFYDRKLVRHRRMREKVAGNGVQIIPQNELDDLIVQVR